MLAFGLAALAVIVIASLWGWDNFLDAWSRPEWDWLIVAFLAQLLALGSYLLAFHTVTRVPDGEALPLGLAVRVVMAGFGPFWIRGGFSIDRHALEAVHEDGDEATVRVLGVGALEWALLAPAGWFSAVVLLVSGEPGILQSLLWPWVIGVPVGFAIGLYITTPSRQKRFAGKTGWRRHVATSMRGVGVLHSLRDFRSWWPAWLGAALYWAFDILCLYSALRFIGLQLSGAETILAYATGYALTRRSTPLGGAGATEALMTFALYWVGEPVASSLAAVVVYRFFNFVLPTFPALIATRSVGTYLEDFYSRRGSSREPAAAAPQFAVQGRD